MNMAKETEHASVFDSTDYRQYLELKAGGADRRTGIKAQIAKALRCQPTYVSQIFGGKADLSIEQAESLNEHFGHSKEESHYFLLLVQRERAGTKSLERYFEAQLQEIRDKRLVLTQRLGAKERLSDLDQATYYSSWVYAAVHIAVTIQGLRSREALAGHLALPIAKVTEVLDTLMAMGLVEKSDAGYTSARQQIRLGNDSKNILRHHTNWRLQAAESLDREQLTDLHYSGVVSLSRDDVVKIKSLLLDAIQRAQSIVRDSNEEELCAIAVDWFSMRR